MTSWTTDRRSGMKRPSGGRAPAFDWPLALLKTVDAALAGVIFVVPLILGGRHDVGRLAFAALAGTAGIAWFARQYVLDRATRLPVAVMAIIGAGALLLVAQLIPFPANWIAWLSPRTAAVLPLWAGGDAPGTLGAWSTITIDPEATRLSLAMFAAYALFFVTVLQRIETPDDAARLMRWIGLSAGLMAVIGLVQFAVPNGKFMWVYEHSSRDAGARLGGAFANRNHFAHFLALGAPALASWLMLALQNTSSFRLPPPGGEGWGGGMRLAPASRPTSTTDSTQSTAAALRQSRSSARSLAPRAPP